MFSAAFTSPKLTRTILFIGLAILLGGLMLFTHLSRYNRHWADDWCYNTDLRHKGFLETLNGYFYDTTYTPSRYSVTLFTGLLQWFDTAGTQWMTPLTLLFWMVGLIWLFRNSARLACLETDSALITFLSALIIYFSVYLTPHLYQSLYWRTGLLTYTTPMVLLTWVFALITQQALQPQPKPAQTALTGFLALLAGGCSEAGATVLVTALALYLGAAWIYRSHVWAQKTFAVASVSFLCAVVAMGLLVFSPTTQIRSARYGDPTPLIEMPRLIFNYTYAFFVVAVKDMYHLFIAGCTALLGYLYPMVERGRYSFKQILLIGLVVVVIAVSLVAASLTPSIYVERGLPAPRTLIIPHFVAALGFALGGWVAGLGLHETLRARWLPVAAAFLLLASFAFPLAMAINAAAWIKVYSERAQAWDAREALIHQALKAGSNRVTVTAIDGQPVGGIRDLDPKEKKGYWITQCAAEFYGIKLDVELP